MEILIPWKDDYNLDIKEIDQQHRKLIDMINVLYNSLVRKESEDELDRTISDMSDYALVHFRVEEKYFEQIGYKDSTTHIAEHQYFIKKVKKFRSDYMNNSSAFTPDVLEFLRKWFVNHIIINDKKYLESFKQAGII